MTKDELIAKFPTLYQEIYHEGYEAGRWHEHQTHSLEEEYLSSIRLESPSIEDVDSSP